MWKWVLAALVALAAILVQRQVTAPARRRKKAVQDKLRRATEMVEASPEDPAARIQLARVLLELAGRPAEALEILTAIDAVDPEHWAAGEKPTKVLIGEACVGLGNLESAIESLQAFLDGVQRYETGGDSERKWLLDTHKVDCEQRVRLLRRGDTHVHQPEQWRDTAD